MLLPESLVPIPIDTTVYSGSFCCGNPTCVSNCTLYKVIHQVSFRFQLALIVAHGNECVHPHSSRLPCWLIKTMFVLKTLEHLRFTSCVDSLSAHTRAHYFWLFQLPCISHYLCHPVRKKWCIMMKCKGILWKNICLSSYINLLFSTQRRVWWNDGNAAKLRSYLKKKVEWSEW